MAVSEDTTRILEAAATFLWSDTVQSSLDDFAANHASMFEGCTSGQEEQKLEWGEAHRSFQELFELHMEQFLATQSLSAEEFVAACQDALDHGTWANCKGLVEVVLSTSTYDYFIKMMIGARPNILETAAAEPDPFDRSFTTRLDAFDDDDEAGGEDGFM